MILKKIAYGILSLLCLAGLTLGLCSTAFAAAAESGTHYNFSNVSNGTVSGTTFSVGGSFSSKTGKAKLENPASSNKKLTFSYRFDGGSNYQISKDGGNFTGASTIGNDELMPGHYIEFSVASPKYFGTAKITLSNLEVSDIADTSTVTVQYESGSVTVDGETLNSSNSSVELDANGATFAATATNFVAWIDVSNNYILSRSASFKLEPSEDMTIKAIHGPAARFSVGGNYLYETLAEAVTVASNGSTKTIVLANNGTLSEGDYTIPSGVTLLIPFNDANTVYTTKPATAGTTYTSPTVYRKLTMASGVNLTVDGAMSVSAKYKSGSGSSEGMGSPSGPIGLVEMLEGSSMTVNGSLYAWGFIIGKGEIAAGGSAKIYENFQVQDFRGGDMTTSTKLKENKVFPNTQYYIQNVEVPMTFNVGTQIITYTSVTVTLLGDVGSNVTFAAANDGMFRLKSGTVKKYYDGSRDRQVYEVNGDLTISEVELSLGIYSVNSNSYVLGLNPNMVIHVKSGTVTINQDMALLPGVELIVEEGAKCVLSSGKKVYVYDADTWGTYCGAVNKTFIPVKYAPGQTYTRTEADLKDVSLKINGTADMSAGEVYTTQGGANIWSDDSGEIKLKAGTDTVTYQVIQAGDPDDSTYVEIPITPAWLKNGTNASKEYEETASYDGTYTYDSATEEWHSYQEGVVTDPTCTESGYTTHTCGACGDSYTTDEVDSNGHDWNAWETQIAPGCDSTGAEQRTCKNCDAVEDNSLPATGHSYTTKVSSEMASAADCENAATYYVQCDNCEEINHDQTVSVDDPLGHDWDAVITTPATCTSEGVRTYTCQNDNSHTKTEVIPMAAHDPAAAVIENKVESTCTAEGSYDEVVYCTGCNTELGRTKKTVSMLAHTPGAGATCTTAQTCTACGAKLSDALGHSFDFSKIKDDGTVDYGCTRGCGTAACKEEEGELFVLCGDKNSGYVYKKFTLAVTDWYIEAYADGVTYIGFEAAYTGDAVLKEVGFRVTAGETTEEKWVNASTNPFRCRIGLPARVDEASVRALVKFDVFDANGYYLAYASNMATLKNIEEKIENWKSYVQGAEGGQS